MADRRGADARRQAADSRAAALDDFDLLITTGFLPQRFRDEMKLDWDPGMQRRFDRLMVALRFVNHLLPRFIRQFPFNVLLKDLDWRIRTGRPLV